MWLSGDELKRYGSDRLEYFVTRKGERIDRRCLFVLLGGGGGDVGIMVSAGG